MQDDVHTPAKRLTERFIASFFDIEPLCYDQLTQGIRRPLPRDPIVGSRLELICVFMKLSSDQVLVFYYITGLDQHNLL